MGSSAKIGDTITLSFQPIEAGGLGYEQQKTFTICGILPTPEAEDDTAYYSALVSGISWKKLSGNPDRLYRTMIRLQNPEGMTTNDILYKAESIARTFSIPEENISENTAYLVANYIDPAFYTTLIGILIVVALAGIITIYSIYYVSTMYKVQEYGKLKALGDYTAAGEGHCIQGRNLYGSIRCFSGNYIGNGSFSGRPVLPAEQLCP